MFKIITRLSMIKNNYVFHLKHNNYFILSSQLIKYLCSYALRQDNKYYNIKVFLKANI